MFLQLTLTLDVQLTLSRVGRPPTSDADRGTFRGNGRPSVSPSSRPLLINVNDAVPPLAQSRQLVPPSSPLCCWLSGRCYRDHRAYERRHTWLATTISTCHPSPLCTTPSSAALPCTGSQEELSASSASSRTTWRHRPAWSSPEPRGVPDASVRRKRGTRRPAWVPCRGAPQR